MKKLVSFLAALGFLFVFGGKAGAQDVPAGAKPMTLEQCQVALAESGSKILNLSMEIGRIQAELAEKCKEPGPSQTCVDLDRQLKAAIAQRDQCEREKQQQQPLPPEPTPQPKVVRYCGPGTIEHALHNMGRDKPELVPLKGKQCTLSDPAAFFLAETKVFDEGKNVWRFLVQVGISRWNPQQPPPPLQMPVEPGAPPQVTLEDLFIRFPGLRVLIDNLFERLRILESTVYGNVFPRLNQVEKDIAELWRLRSSYVRLDVGAFGAGGVRVGAVGLVGLTAALSVRAPVLADWFGLYLNADAGGAFGHGDKLLTIGVSVGPVFDLSQRVQLRIGPAFQQYVEARPFNTRGGLYGGQIALPFMPVPGLSLTPYATLGGGPAKWTDAHGATKVESGFQAFAGLRIAFVAGFAPFKSADSSSDVPPVPPVLHAFPPGM